MKKAFLMFVLCVGLTDQAYRNEVVKIVSRNLPSDDSPLESKFVNVMIHKLVRYRNAGGGAGSTEDIAGRCFAKDLFRDVYGDDPDVHPHLLNHIKGIIEDNFPGEGFAP